MMLEISTISIQILLPLLLISWITFAPLQSRVGFALQATMTLSALSALALVAIWIMPPWWMPYGYLTIYLVCLFWRMPRLWRSEWVWPRSPLELISLILLVPLGLWGTILTCKALGGRVPPPTMESVNIPMPLGEGTYLVANGGSTDAVNGHFLTLDPQTDRQRSYRGQSYAVDLVKLNNIGLRASGWRPPDPELYEIFGEPVFSPCDGVVIRSHDGMPDMRVPETDTTLLEGNHVLINCGEYAVLLAHLKNGSVPVGTGDRVASGGVIGEVGNSGQTFEPHLHVHIQRLAPMGMPLLSGEPVHVRLNGHFPVRNNRIIN